MNKEINNGKVSIRSLSDKYGFDIKRLNLHIKKCLGGVPQTNFSLAKSNLRSLRQLYKKVEEEYDIAEYEEDSERSKGFALQRLISIRKQELEYIVALERMKSSEQLVKEVENIVLRPFIINATDICAQELSRLRKELSGSLGREHYTRIDTAVKDALTRIGERLYQNVHQLMPALNKALSTEHGPSRRKNEKRTVH